MTAQRAKAIEYAARGWSLKPVPANMKRAVIKGWPDTEFGPADFPNGTNISIRLGKRSQNLVDADLDCEEAIALAPLYLRETGATFGRPSAPRSHWLYFAAEARYEEFVDPISKDTLIELRADGRDGGAHITVVPPSVTDGERREWCARDGR
jgi:hypothetical protein